MTHAAPRPSHAARSRRPQTQTILHLEALEDRTLLSAAPIPPSLASAPYDPSQVLVRFRTDPLTNTAPSIHVSGAVLGQSLDLVSGLYEVNLNGLSVANALTEFQADPSVISVEPNYLVSAAGTPNDPVFGSQYALQNTGQSGGVAGVDIRAVQAWDVTSSASHVIISLIDTGIDYNHPDLYQNIWINQAEIPKSRLKNLVDVYGDGYISFRDLNNPINQGVGKITDLNSDGRIDAADILAPMIRDAQGNDTGKGGWAYAGNTQDGDTAHPNDFVGWNFIANNNQPFDDNGHGTNVAGILGATGNNGVGVAGVDWQVQLQEIKSFDSQGFSTIANLVAAIGYSIKHGAKISNNSWAYRAPSTALKTAVAGAQAAGQIFVAAAGNFSNPDPDYPANYSTQLDNIVAVASIDRSGNLASNSNYGATTVALAAPGVNIVSTAPGGGYSSYTGTSQATPFVAGVLALVWEQHPDWTYRQVINQVLSTVTPLASLKGKTITGGIVNAAAAVGAQPGGGHHHVPGPTPHALTAVFSGPDAHSLNRILLTFDQPIDPNTLTQANFSLFTPSNQTVFLSFTPSSDGLRLELDFAVQTAPGNYTLSLNAGVHDQNGDALAPFSAAFTVVPLPSNTFTSAGPTPIPHQGTFLSTITVDRDLPIASLSVVLNITYPADGDLLIHLQAPDGTDVLLVNQRGGSGANFQNTVLDSNARTSIRFAPAPFAGSFQPETPLSTFAGKNARGVWKLWVVDMRTGNSGVLNSWSLVFTPRVVTSPKTAGVSGETAMPLVDSQSNQARVAAVDAVFLSEKVINNWRHTLLLRGLAVSIGTWDC
jgi:serine protease